MRIVFTKAHASGNDFVLLDNRKAKLEDVGDFASLARFVSRRRYSVGADGVLVLEDSECADFKMRIFNPDGSEVAMCGNGIRCSATYAYINKWCDRLMKIETGAGVLEARINTSAISERSCLRSESVMIKMTLPRDIHLEQNIGLGTTIINLHTVNTGVLHAVHFVKNVNSYPVKEMGAKVRFHKFFEPEGTNVNFVEVVDDSTIRIRTYERGVEDETRACGTGVVAAAIISHLINGTHQPVSAITKDGDIIKIHFKKELNTFRDVLLEGWASILFEGSIEYSESHGNDRV